MIFARRDWAPVVLPTLKYATQKHYRYLLDVHLLPAFGDLRLPDISREAIQTFLIAKLQSGLSWETVHHMRCAFSKILASAEEWGYISENLVRKTKLPRREHKQQKSILPPEELRQLIANLAEPARSVVLLLVLTGLRVGELLALRWGNVDLEAGLLRVTETVYEGHFDTPKTRRSVRTIPVGPQTAAILRTLRQGVTGNEALVFATRQGRPLNPRNLLRRHVRPACERLGLPAVSWHTLRHCNATFHDAAGTPLGTVQVLLGHASSEVTRQVYLHAIPADQHRAVEAVERLLFGPKWTQVGEASEDVKLVTN